MKAFISYSHADARLVEPFRKHLKPLAGVEVWIDQMILAGDRWEEAILRQLNDARLILFCVSADFIWSGYIEQVEVKIARERMARGECAVVPVILRDCLWQWMDTLRDLQAVPRDGRPIQLWRPRDVGYADAVRRIGLKVAQLKAGGAT